MSPTVQGEYSLLKKPAQKARIVITLNKGNHLTREEYVINALAAIGERGLFVNALLRGWNEYRAAINKPPSNYSSFRKMIWNMKKKGLIERIPDYEKRDKDLKGQGKFLRSFYRLTAQTLDSLI